MKKVLVSFRGHNCDIHDPQGCCKDNKDNQNTFVKWMCDKTTNCLKLKKETVHNRTKDYLLLCQIYSSATFEFCFITYFLPFDWMSNLRPLDLLANSVPRIKH